MTTMNDERNVEIDSPNYIYKGRMTRQELLRAGMKHKLMAGSVTIEGLVIYGWDEIDMMWAMTSAGYGVSGEIISY